MLMSHGCFPWCLPRESSASNSHRSGEHVSLSPGEGVV